MWDTAQAGPWTPHNKGFRIFDAFAVSSVVLDRDLNAPPVSCADGARYLVKSVATGLWAGQEGKVAIAVGANASNGWYFATVAVEGETLWIVDESKLSRYRSGAWHDSVDTLSRIQDLLDVDVTGLADGMVLRWDASNGVFYAVSMDELLRQIAGESEWTANWTGDGSVYIACPVAMTITQGNGEIGTGDLTYSKSTTAAPGTFGATNLPAAVQAGAWLKITAAGVSGFKATHLRRIA